MAALPGIKDVARRAGVSAGTVSNVLNRPALVTAATRDKVELAIEELGFVRNEAARHLRTGSSRAVGLVVLDAANPFFAELARGVEDTVAEAGGVVLVGNSGGRRSRERGYLDLFAEQHLRGVLLSPTEDQLPDVSGLRRRGVPLVLLDHPGGSEPYSAVLVDDIAGGRLAGSHLVELGHRRLRYVSGPNSLRQSRSRLEGFAESVAAADGRLEVVEAAAMTVEEGRRVGERFAAEPEAGRATAIFAANDLLALGILNAFVEHGIEVPGRVSLVGFDDITFAQTAVVPLTSIEQPAYTMGREGARLLYEELAARAGGEPFEPRRVSFAPRLSVRRSTGPAR